MDSIINMSLENCERNIKFNKKWVRYQLLWLIFILCLTVFDGQSLIGNRTVFSGINFGMMLITSLWTFVFFLESYNELKDEKRKFRYLTELHNTQLASGERQQYISAKKYYDQLRESLEKNNERPSEQSTSL